MPPDTIKSEYMQIDELRYSDVWTSIVGPRPSFIQYLRYCLILSYLYKRLQY